MSTRKALKQQIEIFINGSIVKTYWEVKLESIGIHSMD